MKGHAQWWESGVKAHWGANHAPLAGGLGAAISGWAADECHAALGQKLSEEEDKLKCNTVRAANGRELAARRKSKVLKPLTEGAPSEASVDTRRAVTREKVEGKEDAKARSVARGRVSLRTPHPQIPSPGALKK